MPLGGWSGGGGQLTAPERASIAANTNLSADNAVLDVNYYVSTNGQAIWTIGNAYQFPYIVFWEYGQYVSLDFVPHVATADDEPGTAGGAAHWEFLAGLLTSDEMDAVGGTSGTAVSASNKLVDNSDLRLKLGLATLTFGATIAVDMSVSNNFQVTMTGDGELGNPTGATVGQSGVFYFDQDPTGSRALAFDSSYKFPGGVAPSASSAAGARDCMAYFVVATDFIDCRYTAGIA